MFTIRKPSAPRVDGNPTRSSPANRRDGRQHRSTVGNYVEDRRFTGKRFETAKRAPESGNPRKHGNNKPARGNKRVPRRRKKSIRHRSPVTINEPFPNERLGIHRILIPIRARRNERYPEQHSGIVSTPVEGVVPRSFAFTFMSPLRNLGSNCPSTRPIRIVAPRLFI